MSAGLNEGAIARLRVVEGPHVGIAVRLELTQTHIGTSPDCEVILQTEIAADVRFRVTRRGDRFVLQDLNPPRVLVNDRYLQWPTPLRHGDVVSFSGNRLRFDFPPESYLVWGESASSQGLLARVRDDSGTQARRWRLLMAALARRFDLMLPDGGSTAGLFLERIAEGERIRGPWEHSANEAWLCAAELSRRAIGVAADRPPGTYADAVMRNPNPRPDEEMWPNFDAAEAEVCRLIRDIVPDPTQPPILDASLIAWEHGTLVRLAEDANDNRLADGSLDPVGLSVLADALTDANCPHVSLISHLRDPRPHYRGCWAVDAVLGVL